MAKKIKKIHPNYLIMYKVGAFYKLYDKDCYIIGTNFDYNINIINNELNCGFPKKILRKSYFYFRRKKD